MNGSYPSSILQRPLHSQLLFQHMGLERQRVYTRFARRAKTYGCVHSPGDSTPSCKVYAKGATAVLMFTNGIPSIRGRNGSVPSGDVANELCRIMAEEAQRAGYPPG